MQQYHYLFIGHMWRRVPYKQWGRNEFFLREDLFNKIFWNNKFLAKYIIAKPEIYGRTGTPILPGSALTAYKVAILWLTNNSRVYN